MNHSGSLLNNHLDAQIGLPAAAKLAGVNPATIWRWIKEGVAIPGGKRLHLCAQRLGGRWTVTEIAIREFITLLTEAHGGQVGVPQAQVPRSPAARRKAAERASAELAAVGA